MNTERGRGGVDPFEQDPHQHSYLTLPHLIHGVREIHLLRTGSRG